MAFGSSGNDTGQRKASSSAPLCTLRVQVLAARGLTAKDRNGKSDPFVVVSLPGSAIPLDDHDHVARKTTSVKPKTLDPDWKPEEATFDFPVLPDWFGPNYTAVTSQDLDSDVVRAAIQNVVAQQGTTDAVPATSPPKPRPRLGLRSASTKKISGAATKILVAPVKLGAAGARVVGRQMPRPMRLRKRNALSRSSPLSRPSSTADPNPDTIAAAAAADGSSDIKPPRGSIQLDASNGVVSTLEFVIWDKDKFSGNDYMGECSLLVPQWCRESHVEWSKAQSLWLPVESSRPDAKTSGELQVRIGFVPLPSKTSNNDADPISLDPTSWSVDEIYNRLVLATLATTGAAVRAIPASQSVGTTRAAEAFLDDGLSSESDTEDDEDDDASDLASADDDTASAASDLNDDELDDLGSASEGEAIYDQHFHSIVATSSQPSTPGASAVTGLSPPPSAPPRGKYRRMFSKNKGLQSAQGSGANSPYTASGSELEGSQATIPLDTLAQTKQKRRLPRVRRRKPASSSQGIDSTSADTPQRRRRPGRRRQQRTRGEYAFKAEMGMDIIGIVMLEVKSAANLPRWSNVIRTGFDMDPFVIISFGQKIFRTRVARHTLNPTWNEKLLFHVRRHEVNFQTKFMIYDWDRISSNDYVGGAQLSVGELVDAAPKPDPKTGLYSPNEDGIHSMKEFVLPLSRIEKDEVVKFKGTGKPPTLSVQAKFTPYDALRQRFWRQLALQFDTNDSQTLSRLELTSMLDSLGSTLSTRTIESFFHEVDKNPDEDELTFDEVITALEAEVKKPWAQKRKASPSSALPSGMQTPSYLGGVGDIGTDTNQEFDFGGSNAPELSDAEKRDAGRPVPPRSDSADNEPMDKMLPNSKVPSSDVPRSFRRDFSALSMSSTSSSSPSVPDKPEDNEIVSSQSSGDKHNPYLTNRKNASESSSGLLSTSPTPPLITVEGEGSSYDDAQPVERVVRLQSCPLCHMPRLSKKGEMDIITHLAVCASQDWRRVESLTVRNYVTASQAQRKWYTKVVNKISQGNYQLGANSANIIVQDRLSGELMEEKMQVYVRLGIRLLYQGARSRMEGARVKRMLKNMSVKQGVKFDSPASAREIPGFIAFHNLNVDEIRDPLDSFKTFNEFFYRKLKADARPNDEPENAGRLVSGADCRLMAFDTVHHATKIWIKGRDFTVARLLGEAVKDEASVESYQNGGSLAIFRLAPQDYHRFHCPADAKVGKFTWIDGQYYTVNPMAIRSAIDVYGENIRVVVPFHSQEFGTFYAVCIGAMMVGSTVLTVKEGETVKRGQEFGYFKFGGSTIVLVFEKGKLTFDDDLLDNSRAAVETLVRVGMGIGRATATNNNGGDQDLRAVS